MTKDAIDIAELKRRQETKPDYDIEAVETIKAGVTAIRVTTAPLDLWFTRGVLDGDEGTAQRRYEAGKSFIALYDATQIASGMQFDGMPLPESYTSRTPPQRAMEAGAEMAMVSKALGLLTTTLLINFCCRGVLPYKKSDKDRIKQRETGKVLMALDRLVEHWNM